MRNLYKLRLFFAAIIFLLILLGAIGLFYFAPVFTLQFAPLVWSIHTSKSILAICVALAILILTFVFGRFYCSLLCPMGLIQDFSTLFRKKNFEHKGAKFYKYFLAALFWGLAIGGSVKLFQYSEPYTLFTASFALAVPACIISVLILLSAFFYGRVFCTDICPVGTVLGLFSKFSLLKLNIDEKCIGCNLCEKVCPAGCITRTENKIDEENCLRCLRCLSICRSNAINLSFAAKNQDIKFELSRRNFIKAAAILLTVPAAAKIGNLLLEESKKKYNVILPPGAGNAKDFVNKCINCNLCVKQCPAGIIKKADSAFPVVSISYKNGSCKEGCVKCSEVCPTMALRPLKPEEKKKLRIAIAVFDTEKCVGCGHCLAVCPSDALSMAKRKIILDPLKCIGCGACMEVCHFDVINIYPAAEQKVIS